LHLWRNPGPNAGPQARFRQRCNIWGTEEPQGSTRFARKQVESVLRVGDLTLDEDSRDVDRDGPGIRLNATKFEMLGYVI
jgi:DNA-binding response OmpR family regulator